MTRLAECFAQELAVMTVEAMEELKLCLYSIKKRNKRIAELKAALREIKGIIGDMADPTWHWVYKIDEIARKALKEGE